MKRNIIYLSLLFVLMSCNQQVEEQIEYASENTSEVFFNKEAVHVDSMNNFLGSKSPYRYIKSKKTTAPSGYKPVYLVHLARHGSRFMSGPKQDVALINLLTSAKDKDALTKKGVLLFNEVKLLKETQFNNYGNLSLLGSKEHYDMGKRIFNEYPSVFTSKKNIQANSTYKSRTKESRSAFLNAIAENNIDTNLFIKANLPKGNDLLLRFHKLCNSYENYLESKPFKNQMDSAMNSSEFKTLTNKFIRSIFKEEYALNMMDSDTLNILNGKEEVEINNAYDVFQSTYECWKISKNIALEKEMNFDQFLSYNDLVYLDYISSIESFYEKGKGFVNNNSTYKIALPLLINFIHQVDSGINHSNQAAYLNFAHAETLLPFAILTSMEGHQKSFNSLPFNSYNTSLLAEMATNIQWVVYKNTNEPEAPVLMKILYNEKEMVLPIDKNINKVYYSWNDVKSYFSEIIKENGGDINNTNYKELLDTI